MREIRLIFVGGVVLPKTVLDLGAYDGFASKTFVLPGDKWILVDNLQYLQYTGWEVPKVPEGAEYIISDILDYYEPAEMVVCSNVLYHVKDPHALLRHLRKLTKGSLLLRTYFDPPGKEKWNYHYKKASSGGDIKTRKTIWYRPTLDALTEELNEVGFSNVAVSVVRDEVVCICS